MNKKEFIKILRKRNFSELKRILFLELISNIKNETTKEFIKFSTLERVLQLPQRSLRKYRKRGYNVPNTMVTLFKSIKTFPFLLKVADCKFDSKVADREILNVLQSYKRTMGKKTRGE